MEATHPVPPFTLEEAASDNVSKKDLCEFVQNNASFSLLVKHKLNGQLKSIIKSRSKDELCAAFAELLSSNAWATAEQRDAEKAEAEAAKKRVQEEESKQKEAAEAEGQAEPVVAGVPQWSKSVTKNGNKSTYPRKGDFVKIQYTGMLEDGTVFDTSLDAKKKKHNPLRIKVGTGQVIQGWDESIVTMSVGEKARVTIKPAAAYGRNGRPEAGIPPNATLIFDMELVSVE
eukprot:GILI01025737.1.p1 GENE.GILI01025737.1~~GILI01025737.1.p1  ORF type:complete len:242 (-),score=91.33 GILI01025737.1:132-821(-)